MYKKNQCMRIDWNSNIDWNQKDITISIRYLFDLILYSDEITYQFKICLYLNPDVMVEVLCSTSLLILKKHNFISLLISSQCKEKYHYMY